MNRGKVIAIAVLMVAVALSCQAQPSSSKQSMGSDVPTKEEVLKFLDLMHAKAQMVQAMQGMVAELKKGAEQGFRSELPNATREQLAKLDALFDGIYESIPLDEMVDAVVPIYQKHLTKSDLEAVIAFYSSPPGQKILKELPQIMAEAMQAGGEIGRRAFETKSAEFNAKAADLVKELKK